jgi:hypothetical protein
VLFLKNDQPEASWILRARIRLWLRNLQNPFHLRSPLTNSNRSGGHFQKGYERIRQEVHAFDTRVLIMLDKLLLRKVCSVNNNTPGE